MAGFSNMLLMIKQSKQGMPVFDVAQGFTLCTLKNGRFAYVHAILGLVLPSWPSIKQAQEYKGANIASDCCIIRAGQRWKEEVNK
jgi:hypothetical protein